VLNLGFSTEADEAFGSTYVLSSGLADAVTSNNTGFDTGVERRLQPAFGDEIWSRLEGLGLADLPWSDSDVLDVACGSGFLSFHLLQRIRPSSLTLLDISSAEVHAAEQLLSDHALAVDQLRTATGDIAHPPLEPERFDVVAGNSFLHHCPDVPKVLRALRSLLRPGGRLIGLHEPTPLAAPLELGSPLHVLAAWILQARYFRRLRPSAPPSVVSGTTDVWMFPISDLERLLADAGFSEVRVQPRYLLRPLRVAREQMHLSEDKPRLSDSEAERLQRSVRLDERLRRVLPARFFGGLAFSARRAP
jgi:SAM-dependent methyltransferase